MVMTGGWFIHVYSEVLPAGHFGRITVPKWPYFWFVDCMYPELKLIKTETWLSGQYGHLLEICRGCSRNYFFGWTGPGGKDRQIHAINTSVYIYNYIYTYLYLCVCVSVTSIYIYNYIYIHAIIYIQRAWPGCWHCHCVVPSSGSTESLSQCFSTSLEIVCQFFRYLDKPIQLQTHRL